MRNIIEIMSPVGSYESLHAAIEAGAGSVYFGVGKLNMRARSAANFGLDDLRKITEICREKDVETYLTVNTVVYSEELQEIHEIIDTAKREGISAVIASDISVIQYCRAAGMEVHLSTQCNITNIDAVKFYANFADVIVTARELELSQVAAICKAIAEENICGPGGKPVKIELFVHGALCMAVSGKCYMSLDTYNTSANRGACYQNCRRSYILTDKESGNEIEVDNEYLMSPKDLKTIHFLDKILEAGVSVLKIEGRGRSPEYVKTVTRCYHEAVEAIQDGTFGAERIAQWDAQLASVYNRGFWDGYYLGQRLGEWTAVPGSQATRRKVYVGKVLNYFSKIGVAEMLIETHSLHPGNDILILGPTTGAYEGVVGEIRLDQPEAVDVAVKGDVCAFAVTNTVRRGDKVYRVVEVNDPLFTGGDKI
jgi:putative protease